MCEPNAIVFSGDWHGNTEWATLAIDCVAANDVNTIVHTGDYGYTFDDEYVTGVEKALAEHSDLDIMLYFVDGNHDLHEFLWALPLDSNGFGVLSEHQRYIPRGHRWQWWGKTFMGLGGATSVDADQRTPFVSWWPTEVVTSADMHKAVYGEIPFQLQYGDKGKEIAPRTVDVMIAHDAPSGHKIPGISIREGIERGFSYDLLQKAEVHRRTMRAVFDEVRPRLYVHGHYHVRYHLQGDYGCQFVGLSEDATSLENNLFLLQEIQ